MGNSPKKPRLLKEEIRQRYLIQLSDNIYSFHLLSIELNVFNSKLNYHNSWKYLLKKLLSKYNHNEFTWKRPIQRYVNSLSTCELEFQRALFWETYYSLIQNQSKWNEISFKLDTIIPENIAKNLFKIIVREKNCFFAIITIFNESIIKKYNKEENLNLNAGHSSDRIKHLMYEIESIAKIIIQVIFAFLDIKNTNINENLYPKLYRRIINHILSGYIYNIVLDLFCQEKSEQICILKRKFSILKNNVSIKKFIKSRYFHFDESYRKKFQFKKLNLSQEEINGSIYVSKLKESPIEEEKEKREKNENLNTRNYSSVAFKLASTQDPLEDAIKILLKIKTFRSPFKKLKTLQLVTRSFEGAIRNFWKDYDILIDDLLFGADHVLPMLIYIIIKSNYPEIIAECEMMGEFLCKADKIGYLGYNQRSLSMAISYLLNEMDENNADINDSFVPSIQLQDLSNRSSLILQRSSLILRSYYSSILHSDKKL